MTRLFALLMIAGCADDPTNGLPGDPPGEPGGDDAVWIGITEVTIVTDTPSFSSTSVTRANVTWTFDAAAGHHVPSGIVEYLENTSYDNAPNPPCITVASYSGAIDPSRSSLALDTATYAGVGLEMQLVTTMDTCLGSTTAPRELVWLPASMGALEGNAINFEGTMPAGADTTQTTKYHFGS